MCPVLSRSSHTPVPQVTCETQHVACYGHLGRSRLSITVYPGSMGYKKNFGMHWDTWEFLRDTVGHWLTVYCHGWKIAVGGGGGGVGHTPKTGNFMHKIVHVGMRYGVPHNAMHINHGFLHIIHDLQNTSGNK